MYELVLPGIRASQAPPYARHHQTGLPWSRATTCHAVPPALLAASDAPPLASDCHLHLSLFSRMNASRRLPITCYVLVACIHARHANGWVGEDHLPSRPIAIRYRMGHPESRPYRHCGTGPTLGHRLTAQAASWLLWTRSFFGCSLSATISRMAMRVSAPLSVTTSPDRQALSIPCCQTQSRSPLSSPGRQSRTTRVCVSNRDVSPSLSTLLFSAKLTNTTPQGHFWSL